MTHPQICNLTSANRCYFKNVTALLTSMEHWAKGFFVGFWLEGLLAELQARMSRDCRFLLFWHHNYQVSLIFIPVKIGLLHAGFLMATRYPKSFHPSIWIGCFVLHIWDWVLIWAHHASRKDRQNASNLIGGKGCRTYSKNKSWILDTGNYNWATNLCNMKTTERWVSLVIFY